MLANGGWDLIRRLTLILLTWTIWRAPTNASKWRMGLNSAFKGLVRYWTSFFVFFPIGRLTTYGFKTLPCPHLQTTVNIISSNRYVLGRSCEGGPSDSLLKSNAHAMYKIFKSTCSVLKNWFAARSHRNVLLDFNKVKKPFTRPAFFGVEVDYSKKPRWFFVQFIKHCSRVEKKSIWYSKIVKGSIKFYI